MKQKTATGNSQSNDFSKAVGRALKRAARRAREVARMHGTPIYVLKDGKVVAIKPSRGTGQRRGGEAGFAPSA